MRRWHVGVVVGVCAALCVAGACSKSKTVDPNGETQSRRDGSTPAGADAGQNAKDGATESGNLKVAASIASVSLADDCGEAKLVGGDCAPLADGGSCPSFCQESSLQLNLSYTDGTASLPVSIESVTLLGSDGSQELAQLRADNARTWSSDGGGYQAWDERLAPESTVKASYRLNGLDWAAIAGSGVPNTYRVTFGLRVVLTIGTKRITLVAEDLSRAPPIVT